MQDYEVSVAPTVQDEIWTIAAWYANTSGEIEIGLKWHDGVLALIQSLKDNPQRFGLAHESDEFPYELREMLYGSGRRKTHRVLFRIVGNLVEILVVWHHSQQDVGPENLPE